MTRKKNINFPCFIYPSAQADAIRSKSRKKKVRIDAYVCEGLFLNLPDSRHGFLAFTSICLADAEILPLWTLEFEYFYTLRGTYDWEVMFEFHFSFVDEEAR